MTRKRLILVAGLIAVVAGVVPGAAAADGRDIETFGIPFLPCFLGAPTVGMQPSPGPGNDGAFAQICFVQLAFAQGTQWQASTGEWILFNFRLGPFQTLADCQTFAANHTAAIDLQGASVPVDVSCRPMPSPPFPPGSWGVIYRFLSHPLPAGTYDVTLTVNGTSFPTQVVAVVQRG